MVTIGHIRPSDDVATAYLYLRINTGEKVMILFLVIVV
jgi:hypothetical protein